jgi:hypothetical protein
MRTLITYFAAPELIIADDQQDSGDEFAELECRACAFDPLGHLFKTACGETKCIRCGHVAWR